MQIDLITNISLYIHKKHVQKLEEKANFGGDFIFKEL